MRFPMIVALLGATVAMPALAQDVALGEKEFKKCKACHMIQTPAGEDIVKGGATGPNLYGIIGAKAGAQEGYKYSKALQALNATGEVWTVESLAEFITNPNEHIQKVTGDKSAKSKMTFKLNKNQADIAAYLASVAPGGAS